MTEILEELKKGNNEKALALFRETKYDFIELLTAASYDLSTEEILELIKTARRVHYISFNPANLRGLK